MVTLTDTPKIHLDKPETFFLLIDYQGFKQYSPT